MDQSSIPFQPDMQFQQFQYTSNQEYQDYQYQPQIQVPTTVTFASIRKAFSTTISDDEQPLLEELGINFSHIFTKTTQILNPLKIDSHFVDDTDLAGPLLFCFLIAGFLLLSGKAHFGYIYGVAVLGCIFMYAILNVMSPQPIQLSQTASILGYSLLPIVILSSISILVSLSYFKLTRGIVGMVMSGVAVIWCANSASSIFVKVLEMREQRLLVAYPVALLYSAFAMVTVF